MCITSSCQDFDDTILNIEHRDIKCATTHVKHDDSLLLSLHTVETVGYCSCSRLIDNSLTIETCYSTSIKRSLFLCVVKVRRHCYNSIFHLAPTAILRKLFDLFKDFGADLLGMVVLNLNPDTYHNL